MRKSRKDEEIADKCARQNAIIHSYLMAIDHALLWIAALSLAAYFHLSENFTRAEALLFSTLVAYGAYLCESLLGTVKAISGLTEHDLDCRKAGLWGWIALNIAVNVGLSILFLHYESWIFLVLIILTAGWQKYMDGRIPPRLTATAKPLAKRNIR
ncbi:MAG: hypothetical protein K2N88_09335 [Muribaculaceae bacterium]|nr:hypothetical protein [Muribaculaceae bacterium]